MNKPSVSINDLPPEGNDFVIEDQSIWEDPIREFGMDYKIISPLRLNLFVQPADEGVLLRGSLTGEVSTPCNRCAEGMDIKLASTFDDYEPLPQDGKNPKDQEPDGLITYENHYPMLNLADLAWERFMLSIPSNPVCRDDCKGLCPECGINLNTSTCDCAKEKTDPRMSPLIGLKVNRK